MFYETAPSASPPPGVVFGPCNGLFLRHRRHAALRAAASNGSGGSSSSGGNGKHGAKVKRFKKDSLLKVKGLPQVTITSTWTIH